MPNRSILLVESRSDDVELSSRAFKRNNIGSDLMVARDGVEALDYLFCTGRHEARNRDPLPALVLLDLKLPKLDGLEVLQRIRANERTKRLPVVVLSCSKNDQDLVSSYELGANSYIRKPTNFLLFSEAIRQLGFYWLVLNETPPR